jgi:hypothetical protein
MGIKLGGLGNALKEKGRQYIDPKGLEPSDFIDAENHGHQPVPQPVGRKTEKQHTNEQEDNLSDE